MACGCVVLASDIPALVERSHNAAIHCKYNDLKCFYKNITDFIDNPIDYEKYQSLGYKISNKYSWDKVGKRTLEFLMLE